MNWASASWQLENEAYDIAGQPFNLSSPKQLGEIFFDKLGLPVIKKTATGARSTDEEVLEKLAEDYPLPAKILEHRGLAKLKGTYTDKLAQLAQPAHRARAHALRAGRGRDRAAVQQRPQPAEHPDPHARGPARARGLRGAAGLRDRQRRLQPDRAAHHGPPQRRRGAAARLSPTGWTCTAPRRPRCLAWSPIRSAASSAATPRSSTSA